MSEEPIPRHEQVVFKRSTMPNPIASKGYSILFHGDLNPMDGEGPAVFLDYDTANLSLQIRINLNDAEILRDQLNQAISEAKGEAPSQTRAILHIAAAVGQFTDSPICDNCGSLTVRCGTCYRCYNCGNSLGCS